MPNRTARGDALVSYRRPTRSITDDRMSYSRWLQYANIEEGKADISFYSMVVHWIEGKVPEALVQEKKIATRLRKKVM